MQIYSYSYFCLLQKFTNLQACMQGANMQIYSYTAKTGSMMFIPNCHWNHTKIEFGMIPVTIWYEYHTSVFAVYSYFCLLQKFTNLQACSVPWWAKQVAKYIVL